MSIIWGLGGSDCRWPGPGPFLIFEIIFELIYEKSESICAQIWPPEGKDGL